MDNIVERVNAMSASFSRMREIMDRVGAAIDELNAAAEKVNMEVAAYQEHRGEVPALAGYMDSGQWRKDFEADGRGELPEGTLRAVLSEDGLYNLLQDIAELESQLRPRHHCCHGGEGHGDGHGGGHCHGEGHGDGHGEGHCCHGGEGHGEGHHCCHED